MTDIDENKQKPVLYLASVGSVIQCYCEIPTLQLSEENKTRFDLKIGIYELDENPNGINLCEFWVVQQTTKYECRLHCLQRDTKK